MSKDKNQYVVLRSRDLQATPAATPRRRRRRRAAPEAIRAPQKLEIEGLTLNQAQREDVRRDPRTLAIAKAMPMKLIEPVEKDTAPDVSTTQVAWGVEAVGATNSTSTGAGVTVAVLDTGIDANHPAFAGIQLVEQNFTSDSSGSDQDGHGTHCAGTIFGRDVNGVRIGIAQGVTRALIGKVLGNQGGSSGDIAQAINWAVNEGAQVISMSLGIDFPGYVEHLINDVGLQEEPATSIALEQYRANVNLFSELAEFVHVSSPFTGTGCILVAASGNESARPEYEIAVAPPAAGDDIIAVGALGRTGNNKYQVANFSNTQVDISAPGVGIVSAAMGGGLMALSGTSMATPHVAGVAALWAEKLLAEQGTVGVDALTAKVLASGSRDDLAANAQTEDVGLGMVQAPTS